MRNGNRWVFESNDPLEACRHRTDFVSYLRDEATPDSDFGAAELVYGELIGNVVRHARGHIKIVLEWHGGFAELCVQDSGAGFIRNFALPENLGANERGLLENGRGLSIVRELASAVRVECDRDGCAVRARLPVWRAA